MAAEKQPLSRNEGREDAPPEAAKGAPLEGVTPGAGPTKARIERAALALFADRGVDAVTTREIAAASGVSEGALYRHYPGKERLAETLFFTIHKRLAADVARAAEAANGLDGQARAIVEAYCRVADADWALFRYHLMATHRFLPGAGEARRADPDNPVQAVETIIARAMQTGAMRSGDPVAKAAMALGVVLQTALHKAYGRISAPLRAHADALGDAVIAVLNA